MELEEFGDKFKSDKSFRKKAVAKLSETLKTLGVDEEIIESKFGAIDKLNPDLSIDDFGNAGWVIIHKSDDKKNSTSIIIGMEGLEEIENYQLMREFQEFKAFKELKAKGKLK